MILHQMRLSTMAVLLAAIFLLCLLPPHFSACAADGIMEWSGTTFEEDASNDGSIDNYLEVTLVKDEQAVEFVQMEDMVHQDLVYVDNLPAGLRCAVTAIDATTCRIYIYGKADRHESDDSIENLKIEFSNAAFTTGNASAVYDNGRNDLEISFDDNEYLNDGVFKWSGTEFTESEAGDGSISTVITIKLDRGSDNNPSLIESSDMVADGYAEVYYLPEGLKCIIDTVDRVSCTITLTGKALHHAPEDSIDYLKIKFLDEAFTTGTASQVQASAMDSIGIIFHDTSEEPVVVPVIPRQIVAAFVLNSPSYTVNGIANSMDAAPFARDNRVFVPVRYLAHSLGISDANVVWDGSNSSATITDGDTRVILQIDNLAMLVNGQTRLMDVAPIAEAGRIFLPARFMAEAFGGTVEWHPTAKTVMIYRNDPVEN